MVEFADWYNKQNMKNLFIIWDEPLNITSGGIHRCINCLIKYLPQRGFGVYYLYTRDQYKTFNHELREGEIETYSLKGLRNFLIENNCDAILGQEAAFSSTLTRVVTELNIPEVKLLNQYHCSLLYFDKKLNFDYLRYSWTTKKSLKNRLGIAARALTYPLWRYNALRKQREVYRYNYNHSDVSLLLSEHEIPIMAKITGDETHSRCIAINNPLSWEEIANADILEEKKKEVLIVSRIYNIEKRIDLALKAWEKIEKSGKAEGWTLRIVGDGIDKESLQEMANRMKLQHIVWEKRQDPRPFYRTASIFLLTSIVEGWALTITESMQYAVVPIAFDSYPAVRSIITDRYDGLLIPSKHIDDLAERLCDLMHNDSKREQMALNCLDSCRRFSINKIMDQWVTMMDNLLKDKE